MANRTTANLVKAQAKLIGLYQAEELRYRYPATYLQFKLSSPIMMPNYDELRKREDRTVETNYNLRSSRALGVGGRTHNHTGVKGDSAILTPSWTTYNDDFSMSLKQADNSLYSAQDQMDSELQNIVANFMEGMETLATAHVFSNRSGVNVGTAEGTFDAVDDIWAVPAADEDRAIQITKSNMYENKYSDKQLVFFCDTVSYNKFKFQLAQGSSNATNLSFQDGGITYVHSVELGALGAGLVGAYAKGFWVVAEMGTFGVLPWIPKQNRNGVNTKEQEYSSIGNPIDGFSYAVNTYSERADDSANNGYTQDEVTQYEFSIDQSFLDAPLSTVDETIFQAFAIV